MENILINFSDINQDYIEDLIELSFSYYDYHKNKDLFESSLETLIENYSSILKGNEIKKHLKYLIDFISKYTNADKKFIEGSLEKLNMPNKQIDSFYTYLLTYNEQVEIMKKAMIEKVSNNRIINFSHSFDVKMNNSESEKFEFVIKIVMLYLDDNDNEKKLELDLSLNQFYKIFNELQKIDTMINTLI